MTEIAGTSSCQLALHQDWMSQGNYREGTIIHINLPEQGIAGPCLITSVKHILPQKRPESADEDRDYDFKPITGIFKHQSNDVWKLHFYNGEVLGVTYNHPIYSTTVNDWRFAGTLVLGEEVLTKRGKATLISKEQLAGSHTVYNLEVKDLHNFLVGESGVVVHNEYIPPTKPLLPNMADVFNNWLDGFTVITKVATTEAMEYQARIIGHLNERRVSLLQPHNFSTNTIDIDGFEPTTGTLIEVKHVSNPSASPYTGASTFQPIQDQLMDELRRYGHVIEDVNSPARELRIVTNNSDAVEYLESLMNTLNIPGGAILIE